MLNNEQIAENKSKFLELINQINIPGVDLNPLLNYLETSDFFSAPASTIYHLNVAGGLCQHSLNVYNILEELVNKYYPGKFDKNSVIILGLLHDISKTNFYEKTSINKKIYTPTGSKRDNLGKFEWFAEDGYKVKDAEDRFTVGSHEETSVLLLGQFLPLTLEENVAILHHHFVTEDGRISREITPVYNKYPLASLLHTADFMATYFVENPINPASKEVRF